MVGPLEEDVGLDVDNLEISALRLPDGRREQGGGQGKSERLQPRAPMDCGIADRWRHAFSSALSRKAPLRKRKPAVPAPIRGAMMKSQSCATAPGFEPTPTSAGPIERAGLTEVPVMLMPTRWMAASVSPIARPAKPVGANGWVTPRMQTRNRNVADHLEHEGRDDAVFADIARAPAVLAERASPPLRLAGQDEIEHDRCDDRPENLRDPVADHVGDAHPAGDIDAEAHRGIDVAARDRPDAVGHGDDREAERARDPEKIDRGAPEPIPPITAVPQPKNTSAKVPINSAACLFMPIPSV